MSRAWTILWCLLWAPVAQAASYHLDIATKEVSVTGKPVKKITVNGTIPGPTLHFKEGEEAVVTVTNHMDEDTSIHWHGVLVPGLMDGVPGLNGFDGIQPGETFTYRFMVRQSGTYWYHAHSNGQEQDGLYGALVIEPKAKDPVRADRDYVVLLSDFSEEKSTEIHANLKMHSAYYNKAQRTIGDFLSDVKERGWKAAWGDAADWGQMRMSPTDLADVTGYTFLMNGKRPDENWTALFKRGETVRLRFINASAMSIYDLRIPGLKMTVVAADGQNVEPVTVDEFRFGVAETYDVLVTPKDEGPYTIVAEPIDRSGFALGTLATKEGAKGPQPAHRERALLTMFDMNMENMMKDMPDMDMSSESARVSGWAKAGTPEGHRALKYSDLRMLGKQKYTAKPTRDIVIRLGGNMERYIWTLNDKTFPDSKPIPMNYGERLRLKFINESMMAHPMHLHGMFVQPENGQPADKLPNKHTLIIPPGQSASVLVTADEQGDWPIHCHLLYHMLSGMMHMVTVGKPDEKLDITPSAEDAPASHSMGGHHHAH